VRSPRTRRFPPAGPLPTELILLGHIPAGRPGNGRICFDCSDGGDAEPGQIFEYDPQHEEIALVSESENGTQLEAPDNLTIAPTGDISGCSRCSPGSPSPAASASARHSVAVG